MALVNQGGALRVVGGALGTGQACCCGDPGCNCVQRDIGLVAWAEVTVTIPSNEFDCPGGAYTIYGTLSWNAIARQYLVCIPFLIGENTVSCYVTFFCGDEGRFLSAAYFSTHGNCGQSSGGYSCTLGNGSYVGVGPDVDELATHPSSLVGNVCKPRSASGDYTEVNTGVRVQWAVTVT